VGGRVEEDDPNPARHAVRARRTEVPVDDDDGDDDRDDVHDEREQQVLGDQRDADGRRRQDLGDEQQEHDQRQQDRDAHGHPILNQSINHTHMFNDPLSGTTWVGRYQKSKTNLDFTEARDSEWQWHQLGHMQVCTSLQTDNHASTPPLN